jgi:SAM-dependent methyltransferase
MTSSLPQSVVGYAEAADTLAEQYESITFDDVYRSLVRFVPQRSARVLDIGAGTGRDAAALAGRGHHIVAVEPTAELRHHGQRLHPSPRITWLDDTLPYLPQVQAIKEQFALVLMTAVWMHLDQEERRIALPIIAKLIAPEGCLLMSLRHGPVPAGRRMFDVPGQEVIDRAREMNLSLLAEERHDDMLGRDDVTWTLLAFKKG